MQMYTFLYSGYGESYTVMSDNSESALQAVKNYLKKQAEEDAEGVDSEEWRRHSYRQFDKWKNATVENLPESYSLEIAGPNEVFESEQS